MGYSISKGTGGHIFTVESEPDPSYWSLHKVWIVAISISTIILAVLLATIWIFAVGLLLGLCLFFVTSLKYFNLCNRRDKRIIVFRIDEKGVHFGVTLIRLSDIKLIAIQNPIMSGCDQIISGMKIIFPKKTSEEIEDAYGLDLIKTFGLISYSVYVEKSDGVHLLGTGLTKFEANLLRSEIMRALQKAA